MTSSVAFLFCPLVAYLSCCLAFIGVLPRLPGFTGEKSIVRSILLALVQTAIAVVVFVFVGSIAAYMSIWIGIGGGAKSIPGFLAFVLAFAVTTVYLATAAIIGAGSALGSWKLNEKSAAFKGAVVVLLIQLPLTALSVWAAGVYAASDQLWGYIDKTGKFVIERKYISVSDFKNGVAQVQVPNVLDAQSANIFIDKTGKTVVKPGDPTFFDRYREPKLKLDEDPADYEDDGQFSAGRYLIKHGNLEMLPFSEGLALARSAEGALGWGFVDKSFKFVIPKDSFEDARHFKEGLAPAAMAFDYQGRMEPPGSSGESRKWGYVDRKGKWVVPPTFGSAAPFSEGLAVVGIWEKGGYEMKHGYIDKTGKIVIPASFTYAKSFSEGLAGVRK